MLCVRERERESMLRIRKLTPKECLRLMSFEDKDFAAMKEISMSDASIYHCAGDSIVVSVIMSLMVNLLPIDEKVAYDFIKEYTESIGK